MTIRISTTLYAMSACVALALGSAGCSDEMQSDITPTTAKARPSSPDSAPCALFDRSTNPSFEEFANAYSNIDTSPPPDAVTKESERVPSPATDVRTMLTAPIAGGPSIHDVLESAPPGAVKEHSRATCDELLDNGSRPTVLQGEWSLRLFAGLLQCQGVTDEPIEETPVYAILCPR